MLSEQCFIEEKNQNLVIQASPEEKALENPGKWGRKPENGRALTASERSRAYRERKKNTGCRAKGGRDYAGCPYEGLDKVTPVFIGLDGEAQSDKYCLLAASDGSEISDWEQGLSTIDCFNFLLDLAKRKNGGSKTRAPKARFLWFGMDYDINMILKDVPRDLLKHLWKYKTVRWPDETSPGHYYCISWMPGKRFSVSSKEIKPPRYNHVAGKWANQDKTLASFTSTDVFGFAQEGFVKAVIGWHILDGNDERTAFLNEMKAQRGEFSGLASTAEGREAIRKYNRLEIELLAEMGEKIWETHKRMGLNLGSMHGAGATASLMLNRYHVSEHIKNTMPGQVKDKVLRAYFGGRVQLHRLGRFKEVYAYDLHSAYPWALSTLPSLKDSRWYPYQGEFEPNLWGIWHVRWDCSPVSRLPPEARHMIYPFPFRTEKGRIKWAQQGEGWYWTPEVAAALHWFPGMIQVLEGNVLYLPNAHIKPFRFIPELYAERMRLKNALPYDIGEKVIKLGLNALYGKTAEGAHKYGSEDAKVRLPKHQSYIYAGMITSLVRATMLDAAMTSPRNIIGFATDCIFSRVDLGLPISEELGSWELKTGYYGLFLQPGVYQVHDEAGNIKTRHNRGFLNSEFDWDRVDREWDAWPNNGSEFIFPSRRFIGLGAALANGQEWPGNWRTWQTGNRELSPMYLGQIHLPQYDDTHDEIDQYGFSEIVGMLPGQGVSFSYSPRYEWEPGEDDYIDNTEFMAQPELFD